MGGIGELDLNLLGGLSGAWKKTLSGTGKFAVRNGHLPGVNLAARRNRWAKMGASAEILRSRSSRATSTSPTSGCRANRFILIHRSHCGFCGQRGARRIVDYQGQVSVNPGAIAGSGAIGSIVGGPLVSRVSKINRAVALAARSRVRKFGPAKASRVSQGPRLLQA